ncbi:MAG: DUF2336 domain-containing protein [Alphaproteobacteria bacterium]
MSSLVEVESYHLVLEEPCPGRRGRIVGGVFADYHAGVLTPDEAHTARSLFRAVVRDPACGARRVFAQMVAASPNLPLELAQIMAGDVAVVAKRFIRTSPVLDCATLVDIVGAGQPWRQVAVARRAGLAAPVAAALAEVGVARACVALLENETAEIPLSGFIRLQERFAHDGDDGGQVARALLNRRTVPSSVVEAQIMATSDRLLNFIENTGWMRSQSAHGAIANAVEHALVEFAARCAPHQVASLVRRWARANRVTPNLILRAAAYGEFATAVHGMAALAKVPVRRAWALATDQNPYGLRALCLRAGLPGGADAFVAAARTLTACHRFGPRRDFVLRGLIAGQANFSAQMAPLPMRFARDATLGKLGKRPGSVKIAAQKSLRIVTPALPEQSELKHAA